MSLEHSDKEQLKGEDKSVKIESLDPTFLFTWKGTRDVDENSYHCHDHLELAFVLSGAGRYHIEGQIYEVKEGDLLILNPGVHHQALLNENSGVPTTEFFVGFSDIQFEGYPHNFLPVPDGGHILHTTGELKQKITKLCASMEMENTVCREGRYFMLKAYLMQMILLVVREQCDTIARAGSCAFESVNKKYVVKQIINYFEDHYSEKISLDQIAENMYLSPFYISKIFKSEIGDTPIRHLINIRLERARDLLESDSGNSIQEVAAMVGYDDAYHFSKLFKKRYGISPSQARKQGRGSNL